MLPTFTQKNVLNMFGKNIGLLSYRYNKVLTIPQHDYTILTKKIESVDVNITEEKDSVVAKKTYPKSLTIYRNTEPEFYKSNGLRAPYRAKLSYENWKHITKVDCAEEQQYLIVTKEFGQSIRNGDISDWRLLRMLRKCILITPRTIENYDENFSTINVRDFDSEN